MMSAAQPIPTEAAHEPPLAIATPHWRQKPRLPTGLDH